MAKDNSQVTWTQPPVPCHFKPSGGGIRIILLHSRATPDILAGIGNSRLTLYQVDTTVPVLKKQIKSWEKLTSKSPLGSEPCVQDWDYYVLLPQLTIIQCTHPCYNPKKFLHLSTCPKSQGLETGQ
ncbi:17333_t:CDS:2, partial [Acaulospora colombiana]